ncbi:MAG: hypothetical protein PHO20_02395 [Candidatus Peribacteraceae bacterium]|nr:hypothetical protein [Candidatus Peribacteraceae bacterium]
MVRCSSLREYFDESCKKQDDNPSDQDLDHFFVAKKERRWLMSYLFMVLAGGIAGMSYEWFHSESILDNVGSGCFHGCLIGLGIFVATMTISTVVAQPLNYWCHVAVLYGSFYSTFFLFWFWRKRFS